MKVRTKQTAQISSTLDEPHAVVDFGTPDDDDDDDDEDDDEITIKGIRLDVDDDDDDFGSGGDNIIIHDENSFQ
jgi:hypothetical protein